MSKLKAAEKTFEYFLERLLKGFRSVENREPNNLEMILIKQEAGKKAVDANKVIEFPYKKSFGEEIDEMIAKGEVNVGTADKTPPYQKSQADIEFEIMEKIKADNEKAIKAFESRNPNKKPKDEDPGFYTGGMVDVEPNLSDIGHGSDALMARTRLISPGAQGTTSTGLNYLLAEDNDNIRVPFSEAGIVDPFTAEDKAFKNAMKAFRYYQIHGGKKNFKNYMRMQSQAGKQGGGMENFRAEGGRIGFSKGKIAKEVLDKGRRGFMKTAGAVGAGIAALKTGLLGLTKGGGKEVVQELITTPAVAGKPAWFDALVNKVIREGTDMTKQFATKEREIVHATKISNDEYVRVVQDLDEGTVRVEYESPDNVFGDPVQMEYKKPLPDEGAPNPRAEFTTAESGPVGRQQGPDDYDIEIDEVGGSSIEDLTSDVSKLKEYATGKKPTMKEIVQNKKRKDKAANISNDSEAQMDDVIRRQGDYVDDDFSPDYASGGRIGYSKGKAVLGFLEIIKNPKKIREAIDNIFKTGDYKMDAEMAAESLVELNPEAFGNKLYDDLDNKTRMQVYGAVIDDVMGDVGKKIKEKKTDTYKFLKKVFGDSLDDMPDRDPELYQGLKEVVPIFRQKDKAKKKQELIMYMQKYLPHMGDAEIEEFIVGSRPDIEGLSGQLLRLGSGRDYKAKIDMIKKSEEMGKLKDLEVTDEMIRKPNASGGLAKMLGE